MLMMALSQKFIEEIVSTVLMVSHPRRIILFGSALRSDFSQNSDIDIALVGVGDDDACRVRDCLNESIETLREIDVLSFERIANTDLKRRILEDGRVIYERSSE